MRRRLRAPWQLRGGRRTDPGATRRCGTCSIAWLFRSIHVMHHTVRAMPSLLEWLACIHPAAWCAILAFTPEL